MKDYTGLVAELETGLSHAREQTRVARLNQTTAKLVWEGKEKEHLAQLQALNQRITQVALRINAKRVVILRVQSIVLRVGWLL